MALPVPVLVAVTAGVLVALAKEPGPGEPDALAGPSDSASMAPTMPTVPTAAVLSICRLIGDQARARRYGPRLKTFDPGLLFLESRQGFLDIRCSHWLSFL